MSDLARKILRNITLTGEGKTGVRKDYVDHLTSKSRAFLNKYESGLFGLLSESDIVRDAMLRMVERIFNLLEPYAVHCNNTFGSSDLYLASTAPDESLESVDGDWWSCPNQDIAFYRARISSRRLSLVIRGADNKVDFFIVPADQVMRLSKIEDEYGALMSYEVALVEGKPVWEVEGKPLTDERFERYGLLLFDHFIKQTQEELVRAS